MHQTHPFEQGLLQYLLATNGKRPQREISSLDQLKDYENPLIFRKNNEDPHSSGCVANYASE